MCRKLTLTGWVLMISEQAEQARVLVALLVSIAFFGLQLSVKPLRRCARGLAGRPRPMQMSVVAQTV